MDIKKYFAIFAKNKSNCMRYIQLTNEILDNLEIAIESFLLNYGINSKVTAFSKEGLVSIRTESFNVFPCIIKNAYLKGGGEIKSQGNNYIINVRLNLWGDYPFDNECIYPFKFCDLTVLINKYNKQVSFK